MKLDRETITKLTEANDETLWETVRGIALAKGNFLKVLAGDDLFASPDICSVQVGYLKEHPDACLVVGNIMECDDRMTPLSMSGFLLKDDHDPLLRDRKALLKYLVRKGQKSLATQAICFRKRRNWPNS